MAAGNEILFGRIAVYNRLLTMEQLEECIELQRERAAAKHIAQVMIERGFIDDVQARAILQAQRRRLHKEARPDRAGDEKRLGEILVREQVLDPGTLATAKAAQEEMEERGLFAALGDILVQQGSVGLGRLTAAMEKISRKTIWCDSCGQKYRAHGYHAGMDARCRKCGGRLGPRERDRGRDERERDRDDRTPRPGPKDLTVAGPVAPVAPPRSEPMESFQMQLPSEVRERRPAKETRLPRVGDTVGGCRLERVIGQGGMGEVFLARNIVLDREVALKILAPRNVSGAHVVPRFLAEARAAARLVHPNIVVVHNVGEDGGAYYIEMQFVRGRPVQALLVAKGPFPVRDALGIARQASGALDYAHRNGIVHRDVKPGNIMVGPSGHVTLVDFGLTKRIGTDAHLTTVGTVLGTVQYMSPEQASGKEVDGRSDLYSLGVTLYEMLAGRVPFVDESPLNVFIRQQKETPPDPRFFRPDLPGPVANLILRLLAKSPEHRPASGEELIKDIDSLVPYL